MKTYSNHVYEVEVISIYNQLEKKIEKLNSLNGKHIPTSFLENVKLSIKNLLKKNNIEINENTQNQILVLTPQKDNQEYIFWLTFLLVVSPPLKIKLILQYHLERWKAKQDFINHIEFYLTDILENLTFLNNEIISNNIYDWIYENRKIIGYNQIKVNSDLKLKTESEHTIFNNSYFSPNEHIEDVLINILTPFLENRENVLKRLKKVIFNKDVKDEINLNIKTSIFIDIFKQLNDSKKINFPNDSYLANWIYENFRFKRNKNSTYTKTSIQNLLNYLSEKKKVPKSKRIDIIEAIKNHKKNNS